MNLLRNSVNFRMSLRGSPKNPDIVKKKLKPRSSMIRDSLVESKVKELIEK